MNVDKTLFGMNVIVGASGFGGLFLGIVIARVIGMDDGLGAGICSKSTRNAKKSHYGN